jgi:hypothetical protein
MKTIEFDHYLSGGSEVIAMRQIGESLQLITLRSIGTIDPTTGQNVVCSVLISPALAKSGVKPVYLGDTVSMGMTFHRADDKQAKS